MIEFLSVLSGISIMLTETSVLAALQGLRITENNCTCCCIDLRELFIPPKGIGRI